MIENVSTQLTVFHCLCPLPASRNGLRLTLRSALFGEGGSNWRPCIDSKPVRTIRWVHSYLKEKQKFKQVRTANLVFHACSAPFHARVH